MITIKQDDKRLLLVYGPEFNDARWLDHKLSTDGRVTLSRVFSFTPAQLLRSPRHSDGEFNPEEDERVFTLGATDGDYYLVPKEILGLKYDLRLARNMRLERRTFVAQRNISVFRRIDAVVDEAIVIGGDIEGAVSLEDFDHLLDTFPTSTELTHYAASRVTRVLKDHFETISDSEAKLNRYLERRGQLRERTRNTIVAKFEIQKFEFVRNELADMLAHADDYQEADWQRRVLDLLLFIFPKYIAVLDNVHIKDSYSDAYKVKPRYIDLMLVEAGGNIDIIEIKRPGEKAVLSSRTYRHNYLPRKELAGAIMQAEKYLFHLSKWGQAGEREIMKKHQRKLPEGLELKITNPKAMILVGRDTDFSNAQKLDFEIIRRKYANIVDIMTYDDLLRRVENIITMMSRAGGAPEEGWQESEEKREHQAN